GRLDGAEARQPAAVDPTRVLVRRCRLHVNRIPLERCRARYRTRTERVLQPKATVGSMLNRIVCTAVVLAMATAACNLPEDRDHEVSDPDPTTDDDDPGDGQLGPEVKVGEPDVDQIKSELVDANWPSDLVTVGFYATDA